MNSVIRVVLEGISVSIIVTSIVAAVAIWRGWIPNFLRKDWHETKDEGR